MELRVGVVTVGGSGEPIVDGAGRAHADSYLVCGEGRTVWRQDDAEHADRAEGHGWVLAAVDGEARQGAAAAAAANAAVRVTARLYGPRRPAHPDRALRDYLADAHTRMYWRSQESDTPWMGASMVVAWLLRGTLYWARIGTARGVVLRGGRAYALGQSWPEAESQRLVAGSSGLGDDTAIHLVEGRNTGRVRLAAEDRLVLATDGLWTRVLAPGLPGLLDPLSDPQVAAVAVMERAVSRGADDAFTVVVADVVSVPERAASTGPETAPPPRTDPSPRPADTGSAGPSVAPAPTARGSRGRAVLDEPPPPSVAQGPRRTLPDVTGSPAGASRRGLLQRRPPGRARRTAPDPDDAEG